MGSNFYFKLKDLRLHNQLKFDFKKFASYLATHNQIYQCKYYIGAVKTDKTKKMKFEHAKQRRLFAHLRKCRFEFELGYLLKNNGKFTEKGVDVHMAVDILRCSYEKLVSKIIFISSDTDLIPAIKQARKLKIKVEYVGFSHMPSRALIANCDTTKLLTKQDLERFKI